MKPENTPPENELECLELENPGACDDFCRSADPEGPLTVYQVRQKHNVHFTGTAGEYFRIWIVNLFLTVLTLGIYAAWAKVRTRRYFYAHTFLADQPFDYMANPWFILRGNVFIGAGILFYLAAERLAPIYGVIVVVLFYAGLPFLVYKSLRFNAHNSTYRNIRFRFCGSLKDGYKTYLLVPLMIPLTLGLIVPYWIYRRKKYFFENFSFGCTRNVFRGTAGPFYRAYSYAGLIMMGLAAVAAGSTFLIVTRWRNFALQLDGALGLSTLAPIGAYLAALLAFTFVQQFLYARLTNYCWSRTCPQGLRFESRLKARRLLWLRLTNVLAVILSLGLLIPWAKVRRTRYILNSLTVITDRSLDAFAAAETPVESAVGETATDFFDIDIGL